jgi:hypothetical protein
MWLEYRSRVYCAYFWGAVISRVNVGDRRTGAGDSKRGNLKDWTTYKEGSTTVGDQMLARIAIENIIYLIKIRTLIATDAGS